MQAVNMSLSKPVHFCTLNVQDVTKKQDDLQNENTIANEEKATRIFKFGVRRHQLFHLQRKGS